MIVNFRFVIVAFALLMAMGHRAIVASADDPPLAEKFLIEGRLADGVTALQQRLQQAPRDDQARFGLGVIQFVQAVEHLGQGLHRYGTGFHGNNLVGEIPFLRLPVPENDRPEPVELEDFRQLLQTFVDELAVADTTLAGIEATNLELPLHLLQVKLDLDGDGQISEYEGLSPIVDFYFQRRGEFDQAAQDVVVGFDIADVHWLQGYCHLLSAMAETILAHDLTTLWDEAAVLVFAQPVTNIPQVPRSDNDGFEAQILDAIAMIHAIRLPIQEPGRMKKAHEHLKVVIAHSRHTWTAIENEMDDRNEWIPGPRQNAVLTEVRVTEEMVATWREFLDEAEALLEGKKLAPYWRGEDEELGINLRKVFYEPDDFDLVRWVQGRAALPYLERGEITSPETWNRIWRAYQGNFMSFAVWFN